MQSSLFLRRDKTGNRGMFFAFLLFFIIAAVFLVNQSINESTSKQNDSVADQSAFEAVNDRFNDIYVRAISIKPGERGKIQGRILPYTYNSGTNWISAEQYLPLLNATTIYDRTFDALNLYEIFLENSAIAQDYSTSITAQKNLFWGGSATKFDYVVLPQCVSIEPACPSAEGEEENNKQLAIKGGTTSDFDYCPEDFPGDITNAIHTMEITITFTKSSAVLTPTCSGFGACTDAPFSQGDFDLGKPYAIVHLIAEDCIPMCSGACCITGGAQTIAANINTQDVSNYVWISLESGGEARIDFKSAASPELVKIREIDLELDSLGILAKAKIIFTKTIQELRFSGFESLSVSKPNFGIERKSG